MPTTMQRASTTPLVVFKASAGSGKTFTLAVEYISLLVQEPDNYSRILAVTFTNKATEEMKMRIISQLYGLAQGLAGSQPYLDKVTEKTGYDARVVKERAQVALTITAIFACKPLMPFFSVFCATWLMSWTSQPICA